jgi:hypothetical protein
MEISKAAYYWDKQQGRKIDKVSVDAILEGVAAANVSIIRGSLYKTLAYSVNGKPHTADVGIHTSLEGQHARLQKIEFHARKDGARLAVRIEDHHPSERNNQKRKGIYITIDAIAPGVVLSKTYDRKKEPSKRCSTSWKESILRKRNKCSPRDATARMHERIQE